MDWNKEMKAGDLFNRGPREPTPDAAPDSTSSEPAAEPTSKLKKEIKLSLRRGPKEPKPEKAPKLPKAEKQPKAQKEPKQPKGEKEPKQPKVKRAPKQAPPLPQVPLMRSFNLLPRDDPRQTAKGRSRTQQLALAVVGLVLFAGLGSMYMIGNAKLADKRAAADDLRAEVAEATAAAAEPGDEAEPVDPALLEAQRGRTSALSAALGKRVAWDRVLRELSLVLPEDVWFQSLTASPLAAGADAGPAARTGATIQLNGYTREQDGVAHLLARLAVVPELASVTLLSSVAQDLNGSDVVLFTITAIVKAPLGATA